MGLTLAYEGMMLLGAMVATIIVGVITASDLSGVQWDGIISLISVFVAFGFLLLMRHRDIFTCEFWLGGQHRDSYGEPNQLGHVRQYGGGRMQPLWALMFIVLGMGVPTTANYCIMASTCAPILITLGIPKVAAHFFVFYFGSVADITPPVALAAYAGSAIAKSDPMMTGITATKPAIAAFIVPYIFAMNPSMLLMDQGVLAAIQVIITSCLGSFGSAAALEGDIVTRAPWWQRILLAAGGLCLIDPEFMTDVVGVAVIVVVIVLQIVLRKHSKPAAA